MSVVRLGCPPAPVVRLDEREGLARARLLAGDEGGAEAKITFDKTAQVSHFVN